MGNLCSFRFVDPQLQSSLVKAIHEAGISCEIDDDGAIVYPPQHAIEVLIAQVVETVFPEMNYYRTDVSDTVTAERYRHFKKHTGKRFIEEIRNGTVNFVQELTGKLFRYQGMPTHISYSLTDEALDPDTITELLGISPTFVCRKGDPFTRPVSLRRKDIPPLPSTKGWWELCSTPQVESNNVQLHLKWLLEILEPVSSKLKCLAEQTSNPDYRILQINTVGPKNGIGGLSLPGSMFERIGILAGRVDIRCWTDDYI